MHYHQMEIGKNWIIPVDFVPPAELLIDSRLSPMFHSSELIFQTFQKTKCQTTANIILKSIDNEITRNGIGFDTCDLWNLLDYFEVLVAAVFCSKTTLDSATCIGKFCSDEMAEALEYDSKNVFNNIEFGIQYELCLRDRLTYADVMGVSKIWRDLTLSLCERVMLTNLNRLAN